MLSTDVGAAPAAATRLQESAAAPGTGARREPRTSGQDDDFGEMFDRFADESTPAEAGRTAPRKGAPTPGLPQPGVSAADGPGTEESPSGRGVVKGALGQLPTWEPGSQADEPEPDLAATVPVFDARLIVATQLQPQARGDMPVVPTQGQTRGGDRPGSAAIASQGLPISEAGQGGTDASAGPFGLSSTAPVPSPSIDGLPMPEPTLFTTAEASSDTGEVAAAPALATQPVPVPVWNPQENAAAPTVAFDAARPAHDGPAVQPQLPGPTPTTPTAPAAASGVITPDGGTARQVAMAAIRSALARELDTATPSATPSTPPAALPPVPVAEEMAPTVPDAGVAAAVDVPQASEPFDASPRTGPVPAGRSELEPRTPSGAPAVESPAPAHHLAGSGAKAGPVAPPAGAAVTITPVPPAASAPVTSAAQTPEPAAVAGVDSKPAGDAQPLAGRAQTPAAAATAAVPAPSVEAPGVQVAAAHGRKGGQTDEAPHVTARPPARVAHAIAAFQAASLTGLGAGTPAAVQTPASVALPDTLLDQELPTQIVQAIRVQFEQGSGEARLRLNPGFLGGMTVGVQVDGTSVVASLYASSSDVRDWMQRNEQVLRQSLADQGLQLERLVIVDEEAQAAADDERGRGQREQQEQQSSRRPRRPVEEGTFELVL